ncbi:MAG: exodeoxyribonuclease V subunit alpha [Desulfobacteraceae bacterium]|nr:MAG: exodeoxyribonuclease V subunit alpha [Desulfobacteraceae bacterium]
MWGNDSKHIRDRAFFSPLDLHFARFMEELNGGPSREINLAAALASRSTREGNVCVDLASLSEEFIREGGKRCPNFKDWSDTLIKSQVVGRPGDFKPLILDETGRLYLYRYWDYERKLVEGIVDRAVKGEDKPSALLGRRLNNSFPGGEKGETDLQKVATFVALTRKFCVISGGPGTGKTHTMAGLLPMAVELFGGKGFRIALAAPTGKAAARMQKSMADLMGHYAARGSSAEFSEAVISAIPKQASTIHRLLGAAPGSPYFLYNSANKLSIDMLIIDEASMVDLALMSKLIQALPSHARFVLLGDRNQLASVEAGAVLGDICYGMDLTGLSEELTSSYEITTGDRFLNTDLKSQRFGITEKITGLRDCMIELEKNYRFGAASSIAALSLAVKEGRGEDAIAALKSARSEGPLDWMPVPENKAFKDAIRSLVRDAWPSYLRCEDPVEMLRYFDEFRILCAVRKGPQGVEKVNALVEEILWEDRLIDSGGLWYSGRPILVTGNDYSLRLYNGDLGIAFSGGEGRGELKVFFASAEGGVRSISPHRLPSHETAFATTVHKSQGSEFNKVLLILPERDSPVLTRELVYTGLTRGRKRVVLWAEEEIVRTAISRRIERASGLRDALWGIGS